LCREKNVVWWRDQTLKLRSDWTRRGKAVPLTQTDVARAKRKPALTGRGPASGHVRPGALGRVFVALDPLCTNRMRHVRGSGHFDGHVQSMID
jgi:hypothetical protein